MSKERFDPTNIYHISDLDTAGATQYFGYVTDKGEWYIMQLTDTGARYTKGGSNYYANWINRAILDTYDYFYNTF